MCDIVEIGLSKNNNNYLILNKNYREKFPNL